MALQGMCLPLAEQGVIIGGMKRTIIRFTILALLVGAVSMVSGCVAHGHAGGVAVVDVAPPAPTLGYYYEPRAGHVWVEGRWVWDGYQWQWRPGYWVAARPGFVYVQGYWDYRGTQYIWVRGRWARHRPGYIYSRGYWDWRGGRYHWKRGRWVRNRPGHTWTRGRWGRTGPRRTWVPGRWTKGQRVRDHRRGPGRTSPPPRRNERVPARRGN
jgi:hypothetical protein